MGFATFLGVILRWTALADGSALCLERLGFKDSEEVDLGMDAPFGLRALEKEIWE